MADFVYNVAKGHVSEFATRILANDPTNAVFVAVLLKASVADGTAEDYDDLSLVLGDASTTESDATDYVRKLITDSGEGLTRTIDDTNNRIDIDVSDIVWTGLGGATNNTLTDLLFCYDSDSTGGTDANIVPCTQHDFALTTQDTDVTAQVANFFRAS